MTDQPDDTPTEFERGTLGHAIRRALEISEAHPERAPIVAAIARDGEVLAWGDNEVHIDGDPSRHAEIVAMSNAAADGHDLAGATIVTTLEPCEMCVGAIGMAGISRIIYAGGREAVAPGYFAFPDLTLTDYARAARDPFTAIGPVMQDDVLRLYAPEAQQNRQD